jgi:WD40 repeat protein
MQSFSDVFPHLVTATSVPKLVKIEDVSDDRIAPSQLHPSEAYCYCFLLYGSTCCSPGCTLLWLLDTVVLLTLPIIPLLLTGEL